jgi:hypothetical protein
MNNQNKYVFFWPGIIKVYVNNQLVYEGNDWKAAQLATVPF